MDFYQLIDEVKLWIRVIKIKYASHLTVKCVSEEKNMLRYIINSKNYIAELLVEPDGFHKHRYVSFTAMRLDDDVSNQDSYFYFDNDKSTLEDIMKNLEKGVGCILR